MTKTKVRADIDAAMDIIEYIEAWPLQVGDKEVLLGEVYFYDVPLKGLYKQIPTRIEQAIREAWPEL